MKQDKQDRRSQRTRHLICSAMMELMREKRYDAITVQDLLDRADIGRSTFYSHYFDKDDVLTSISEQMLELFRQQLSQRGTTQRIFPSLELFQHAQESPRVFQSMMAGQAGNILWDKSMPLLCRGIEQALATVCVETDAPKIPLAVVALYLAGSFGHLLKWWLENDMPYSAEEMENIFQQLVMPGVWAQVTDTR